MFCDAASEGLQAVVCNTLPRWLCRWRMHVQSCAFPLSQSSQIIVFVHPNAAGLLSIYPSGHNKSLPSIPICLLRALPRSCPPDLLASLSTVVFAASHCTDLPELRGIKQQLALLVGRPLVQAAEQMRPEAGADREVSEACSEGGRREGRKR